MKLPPNPDVDLEYEQDEGDEEDDMDSPDTETNAKVVMFPEKSLGLRMEKGNAEAFVGDRLFNARVQAVNAEEAIEQGVQAGDVIITVGEWSAEGASIGQVVAQIKKHKSRPLKLTFA